MTWGANGKMPRYILTIRDGHEETNWQHYRNGDLHTLVKHDRHALSLTEQADFLERKRLETRAYTESEWQDWVDGLEFRDPKTGDSAC